MKQYSRNLPSIKKLPFFLLVILCVLIAFRYRSKNYWLTPPVSDTFDEFAAGWIGLSLFKTGIPTSWSFIPDYASGIPAGATLSLSGMSILVNGAKPNLSNYSNFPKPVLLTRELELEGFRSHFNIVSPDLEQPPLGGIIISLPLILTGVNSFSDVTLKALRAPFIFYGTITTVMVIMLANMLYGKTVALVSGLVYATVPTIVISSRMALPENLLTLLFLLEMLALERYRKNKKYLYIALLISLVAPLVKPFGLTASLIGVVYFAVIFKDFKISLRFIYAGLLSFLFYIFYGMYIDKTTFFTLFIYQSNRFFSGPLVLVYKVLIPRITKIFYDGWIFFGWISFFYLSVISKKRRHFPLLIAIVSYLLVVAVFGGEDYGWYRFPLYPFLIIASGYLISKMLKTGNFFINFIFLILVVSFCVQRGLNITDWNRYINFYRFMLLGSIAILSLYFSKQIKYIYFAKIFMIIVFISTLYLNTRIINNIGSIWATLGDSTSLILERK